MGYMAAVRCSAQCTDLIYQCITRYHPDHPLDLTKCISVGAYDSRTNRTAAFSGRGYTWAFDSIKPDIIAPGVDIISCSNTGGYTSKTGTSMAAPFVTGAAALLMDGALCVKMTSICMATSLKLLS